METILLFELDTLISSSEANFFHHLMKQEYEDCETVLSDFCFALLDLTDLKQVFIARTFFIGILTNLIRVHTSKSQLQANTLKHAYEQIIIIEKWENITEFILAIPDFLNCLTTSLVNNYILYEGNHHITKALSLINDHITAKHLSVRWLAEQLNISPTHLSNSFKIHLDETITSYIAKRKMKEIIVLMTYTTKSLQKISEQFNFSSFNYFIQYFKKHQGITPLQFRRKLLK